MVGILSILIELVESSEKLLPVKTPQSIGLVRGSARIYATSGFGAIIGLASTALLGLNFGTGPAIETFFVATTTYFVVTKMLQTGAVGGVATPILLRMRQEAGAAAESRTMTGFVAAALVGSVVGALAISVFIGNLTSVLVPGFDETERNLVVPLTRILSIGIAAIPVSALFTAFLNANSKFGWPEMATVSGTIINLAFIGIGAPLIGIEAAAYGMVAGAWLSAGVLAVLAVKGGWKPRLRDVRIHAETEEWFRGLRPYVAYTMFMQAQAVVFVAVLSALPDGSLAYYRYGVDLVAKGGSLLNAPVNAMALPYMAQAKVSDGVRAFRSSFAESGSAALLLGLLPAVFVSLNADLITALIWGRGEFSAEAVREVATVIAISALALPLQFLFSVFQKGLVALQKNVATNVVSIVGQIALISLVFLLVPRWGHIGAAWVGPIGTLVGLITASVVLWRAQSFPDISTTWRRLRSYIIPVGITVAAVWGVKYSLDRVALANVVELVVSATIFAVIGLATTILFKSEPIYSSWLLLRRRFS